MAEHGQNNENRSGCNQHQQQRHQTPYHQEQAHHHGDSNLMIPKTDDMSSNVQINGDDDLRPHDWLDGVFNPCPPCIRGRFDAEAIDNVMIFSGLRESELDELCNGMKIGHRVRVRQAYTMIKSNLAECGTISTDSMTPSLPAQPNSQVKVSKKRKISPDHKKKLKRERKQTYIITSGVKRMCAGKWTRLTKYEMTRLSVPANCSYTDLLNQLKVLHGITTTHCVLLNNASGQIALDTFTLESYVRSKTYVGCTRIYVGLPETTNIEVHVKANIE